MTDLVWQPGGADCAHRTTPIAGVLWHWTAGEGTPDAVVRVLKQRGLSIHYVIGYDGVVKQCADPASTVCFHGGKLANRRFVGVEICNKGLPLALQNKPRDVVSATAHGRTFRALDFTEAQHGAVVLLADELSERYGIPRVTATGDTVINVSKFAGHAEHIHISRRKIDCGGLIMRRLRAHGYK